MTLWLLLAGEIAHRRLSFALGCLSVAIAVGAVVGSFSMLRGHDLRTERLVEEKEARTREEMVRLENDYRLIMKRMGYNVMILPASQDLSELLALGYPTQTLPESYAERLAESGFDTLNHLLPVLQRRIVWPETGENILLCGVRGQMALPGGKGERAPIQAPIPAGRVALGHTLAARVDATAGEPITLMGERFIVERVDPMRGTIDDMAVWAALDKVQGWLNEPGRISGILALECVCHADSLGMIVDQVTALLPDTQVFEFSSIVRGRAEARDRAAAAARLAIEEEKAQRLLLRSERVRLARGAAAAAVVGAALWVMLLAYGNARDRRSEIGMLRAVGLRERQILTLLLGKALLMGACGGAIGLAVGWVCGARAADVPLLSQTAWTLAGGWQLAAIWLLGPLLAGAAAFGPALAAARRDPADVLGRE